MSENLRVAYAEMVEIFAGILRSVSMQTERAQKCAGLFADASRDGVASHGVNRFAAFVRHLREGITVANIDPVKIGGDSAMERWDGRHGVGPLNASFSMARAVELAKQHGIGAVALARTNHWMRAGNYGWQAAQAGCIGICWTNATPTMAAWGGKLRNIGNNPLVLAVPRSNGEHVVLDMAMSQYSFGKLGVMERAGQQSPLVAGFDADGHETHDPAKVLHGGSAMPIGYWKGSGLAIMLDLIATTMTGGKATWEVAQGRADQGVSQMFFAMDPTKIGGTAAETERNVEEILASVKTGDPAIRYPGEGALRTRRESMEKGVPVDPELWGEILKLAKE